MNILAPFKPHKRPRNDDADLVDLTKVQRTNVPSIPRPLGLMPSTRLGATISSKPARPFKKTDSKKLTRGFLDTHDYVDQDPIQVSDTEDGTRDRSNRSPQQQLARTPASQPAQSHTRRINLNKHHSLKNAEEDRLFGDPRSKKPADAVSIQIPTGPTNESIMPVPKFHKGFKPVDTLNRSAHSTPGSKEDFYGKNVNSGRVSSRAFESPPINEPKRKSAGPPRHSEPPMKKSRTSAESPDVLQGNGQEQGSKTTKLKLQSVNHSIHDLSSSPTSAMEARYDYSARDLQAGDDTKIIGNSPRKIQVPWDVPTSSATYTKKITSRPELESGRNSFMKRATQQRRHEEAYDDDSVDVLQSRKSKAAARNLFPTSTFSAQQHSRSPSQHTRELEEIFPDGMLQPRPAGRSSPDIIQEDTQVVLDDSKSLRGAKTALTSLQSSRSPQSMSRKTSADYNNQRYLQMYRPERMLFVGALGLSSYVLVVDKADRTFSIDYDNNLLEAEPIASGIPVDRIRKVYHGTEGSMVRIMTADLPVIGHEILLELKSHKRACDLSSLLQTLGKLIDVTVATDSWLDKIFNNFNTTIKTKRNVDGTADHTLDVSPYFTSANVPQGVGANVGHKLEDPSFRLHDGSDQAPVSRERRSAVRRRQHELQEDYDERARSAKIDPSSKLVEASFTRSRSTRNTPAFRSASPYAPPAVKYSQCGRLGEPWQTPLAYPSNGKKRATVNFDDLSRLDDDEFLNDNLIAFFLRYLEHYLEQEQPEISKRSYFFNSYFYEKLRQKPKDRKSVINYEGVTKWTEKIGLFNRDFIVVPVNENLHWYLAIICNLSWFKLSEAEQDALEEEELRQNADLAGRETATENAHDTQQSLQELSLEDRTLTGDILLSDLAPESSGKSSGSAKKKGKKRKSEPPLRPVNTRKPAIITLDSLGLTRYPTVSALKQYIAQEASTRLKKEIDIADIHGVSAKAIPIQNNYSDCGLFLCAYLEKFVVSPTDFVKQELGRTPQQWPTLHSHNLRSMMREFILNLHQREEGKSPDKAIPSVGKILLPPVTPPRPAADGASVNVEIESTLYDPPISPVILHGQQSQDNERRKSREPTYGSDDDPIDINGGHEPESSKEELTSISDADGPKDPPGSFSAGLRARTAKILSSPVPRYDSIPESDSEPEVVPPPVTKDNPAAMAQRMAKARSLKRKKHVRSNSVSTDYLNGTRSYERPDQQMHDDDAAAAADDDDDDDDDDDEMMML